MFLQIMAGGFIAGFCFDIYRMLRRQMKWNQLFTFLGDIALSIGAFLIIAYFAEKANYLDLRFYVFLGVFAGLFLYLKMFSRWVKRLAGLLFRGIAACIHAFGCAVQWLVKTVHIFVAAGMSLPYAFLQWLGLLFYRSGEAAGRTIVKHWKK